MTSKVVRYDVSNTRKAAAKISAQAGVAAAAATGAQALMLFASLMTFVIDNHAMPYGIALTHWITAAIMGISTLIYVLGKDTTVDGEFSVKATALYDQLDEGNRLAAKPILDKIYELEAKHPDPSREMQNVLVRRVEIIEKMVDAEKYAEELKAVEDKSDTYTAMQWLTMVPNRPALEAGPSAKKEKKAPAEQWIEDSFCEQNDHDEYGFPNYGKYGLKEPDSGRRVKRKVYEGEVY